MLRQHARAGRRQSFAIGSADRDKGAAGLERQDEIADVGGAGVEDERIAWTRAFDRPLEVGAGGNANDGRVPRPDCDQREDRGAQEIAIVNQNTCFNQTKIVDYKGNSSLHETDESF